MKKNLKNGEKMFIKIKIVAEGKNSGKTLREEEKIDRKNVGSTHKYSSRSGITFDGKLIFWLKAIAVTLPCVPLYFCR